MEKQKEEHIIFKIGGFVIVVCLLFFKGIPINISVKSENDIPVTVVVKNDRYGDAFKIRHSNY